MRTAIILLFFISVIVTVQGQDEAYSNETRDNIFDSGSGYYSLSYGTDLDNRFRITGQMKGIIARNLSTGTNFFYSQSKDKLNNWGLGWSIQNYFLNGNTRPFVELQLNAKASEHPTTSDIRFNAEGSASAGFAYFININGGYFTIETFAQYYAPIFTDVDFETGLIPTLRVGFVY